MNASTLTYCAIARKDWSLLSVEKYLTIEEAKKAINVYKNTANNIDYNGKIIILKTDETNIWDENGFIVREVRTALVEY